MTIPTANTEETLPATIGSYGVTVVGRTHRGMVRSHNEDTFGAFMSLGLFVVCDGMGGHAGGEVASDLALRTVFHSMFESTMALGADKKASVRFLRNSLTNAVHRAHHTIRSQVDEQPHLEGMGTTFAALQVSEQGMVISHVGDSRIYRWSERRGLVQLTQDHSLLNQISAHRTVNDEEADRIRNVIVNAVGVTSCKPDTTVVQRNAGDVFLLCSDGLSDLVSDAEIQAIIEGNEGSLERAAQELVASANKAGGHDNITVLLVRDEVGSTSRLAARTLPFISGRGSAQPDVQSAQPNWVRATINTISG